MGDAAGAPPPPVQDPQNNKKRPYFGQDMLHIATFEALDFKIFRGNMLPDTSSAYKSLALPAAMVSINSGKKRRPPPRLSIPGSAIIVVKSNFQQYQQ